MIAKLERLPLSAMEPKDSEKNQALLERLREQAKWRFVRVIHPLFRLFQHEDGRWAAEISADLQEKVNTLKNSTHTDPQTAGIVRTIFSLGATSSFPPGTPASEISAAQTYETLHGNLVPRLRAIMHAGSEDRQVLAKKLKKDLAHAIDSFASPERVDAHGNATIVSVKGAEAAHDRIEVRAVEMARDFVENHQCLPTKQQIQGLLEKEFPEVVSLSKAKWAKVWKIAGLESLPRADAWGKK